MPRQNNTKGKPADDSNESLARHISEAIRITNERDDLPACLYNGLCEAWNDFVNDLPSLAAYQDSEPYMVLTLDTYAAQMKAREGKVR